MRLKVLLKYNYAKIKSNLTQIMLKIYKKIKIKQK